jgi:hypothetical protein
LPDALASIFSVIVIPTKISHTQYVRHIISTWRIKTFGT